MHGWLFNDIHVLRLETLAMLANDPLKLNNVTNAYLINPNTLYYFSS